MRLHARVSVEPVPADAPVVILVHGLAVSSAYMVPTAVRLAPDFAVYAPDLPGFGASDSPTEALDVPRLADALVAWMDAAGIGQAMLVGNSLGCQIIVSVAVRHPERVRRLVLQGPTVDRFARSLPRQLARLLLDVPREHPTQPLLQARDYLRFGVGRTLATFRFARRDRIEDRLPLVRAPTLVVHGERDLIVSRRWVDEVTALLPTARLVVLPGAAHTPNYSTPTTFVRAIRPFLERADDEGPSP